MDAALSEKLSEIEAAFGTEDLNEAEERIFRLSEHRFKKAFHCSRG